MAARREVWHPLQSAQKVAQKSILGNSFIPKKKIVLYVEKTACIEESLYNCKSRLFKHKKMQTIAKEM